MPKITSPLDRQTPFEEYFNSTIKGLGLGFNPEYFLYFDFERNWELKGNPLFVWGGMLVCEVHNLKFPYWILDYIYQKAKGLTFKYFSKNQKPQKTVYDLLGFNLDRAGKYSSQFQNYFLHYNAYFMVEEYLKKVPAPPKSKAFKHVGGRLHLAPETIRKWHKLINDSYDNDLPDLLPENWSGVYVRIRTHDPKKKNSQKAKKSLINQSVPNSNCFIPSFLFFNFLYSFRR